MVANKAIKADAIGSASLAHGFAILCASDAPLLGLQMNQELRVLLESFKSGTDQSLQIAQKIESIICIEYAEDHPLQELAEFLAQYRPGGGEFLYSETEAAQEVSMWLNRFP